MNYWLLSSLAFAPILAIIMFVYFSDHFNKEPVKILLFSFFWGCVSIYPAIQLEYLSDLLHLDSSHNPLVTAFYAIFIIAMCEEACKFLFLRFYCYRQSAFDEPYDGIIYSVMIGMGFASVENAFYIFGQESFHQSLSVALLRTFSATPAHATFAIVMGYFIGLAKFNKKNEKWLLFKGLIIAVGMHGIYDFFLMQQYAAALTVGAMLALSTGIHFSLRAIHLHREISPFRPLPSLNESEEIIGQQG